MPSHGCAYRPILSTFCQRRWVGKRVKVQGYSSEGVLRFFGKHHLTGATRAGVELDDPVGKNNGTVKVGDNAGL